MERKRFGVKQLHICGFRSIVLLFRSLRYGDLDPQMGQFHGPVLSSFYNRWLSFLYQWGLSTLRSPVPCRYINRRCNWGVNLGYLVIDYIDETHSKVLSSSWEELLHHKHRRTNLFNGLSQIMLELAQVPLPRIGLLTVDKNEFLCLSNRPLALRLQQLENEGIPTNIDRNLTYSTTESRILHQPNAIQEQYDGQAQLAALATMRAIMPHFIRRDLRHEPFILTLTNIHQSNIFVDEDWNVKCLIDLEWACLRPIKMVPPPCWLTSRGVDQLTKGEHLEAYSRLYEEFTESFEKAEASFSPVKGDHSYRTRIMKKGWTTGNFWYFHALYNPKGLYNIFLQHIQPRYTEPDDAGMMAFEDAVARRKSMMLN